MKATLYTPARLADDQIARVRAFEQKTGRILLAFQALEQPVAPLSEVERQQLMALEQDLGVVMVACSDPAA